MVAPVGIEGVALTPTGLGSGLIGPQEFLVSLDHQIGWYDSNQTQPSADGLSRLYTFNMTPAFLTNRFNSAQSIFIDNSTNGVSVTVKTDKSLMFTVPPFTTGMYPLICLRPATILTFSVSTSGGINTGRLGTTRFSVFNREHPPFTNANPPERLQGIQRSGPFYFYLDGGTTFLPAAHIFQKVYGHYTPNIPTYTDLEVHIALVNAGSTAFSFNTDIYLYDYDPSLAANIFYSPNWFLANITSIIWSFPLQTTLAPGTLTVLTIPVFGSYFGNFAGETISGALVNAGLGLGFDPSYVVSPNISIKMVVNGTVADRVIA